MKKPSILNVIAAIVSAILLTVFDEFSSTEKFLYIFLPLIISIYVIGKFMPDQTQNKD